MLLMAQGFWQRALIQANSDGHSESERHSTLDGGWRPAKIKQNI